jgi:hypothetical protein
VLRRASCLLVIAALAGLGEASARAEGDTPPLRAEDVHLEPAQTSANGAMGANGAIGANGQAGAGTTLPEAPLDAPPPMPRKKGFVVEGSLGALGFFGQFRHVAPAAPWIHMQFGYEFTSWLMLFLGGDLAFTDTSIAQDPTKSRAFPIFGFGVGPRVTLHVTERVALFGQVSIGALKADVPKNAFAILGYRDAESLGLDLGARVGVEWFQIDRHMALGLAFGLRDAKGFAKLAAASDSPLMWDGSAAIRYTF